MNYEAEKAAEKPIARGQRTSPPASADEPGQGSLVEELRRWLTAYRTDDIRSKLADVIEIADRREADWQARLQAAEGIALGLSTENTKLAERVLVLTEALDSLLGLAYDLTCDHEHIYIQQAAVLLRPEPPAAGDDEAGELAGEEVGS